MKFTPLLSLTIFGLASLAPLRAAPGGPPSPAESAPAVTHSVWEGYDRIDFLVDGRKCLLVAPKTAAPGKPWIWRTEFFGHEPQGDIALLGHGLHVAYVDVQNMYGAPVALDHMDRFYEQLTKPYGLSPKPVLEGFSRGGLFAYNWAARHPDRVAAIYADAPVCDFKSWPGGCGKGKGSPGDWEGLKKIYGFTEEQALAYPGNPVDNLAPLAAAKIPLLNICGDADDIVPMEENTTLVEKRYKALGGDIQVIVKPGVGHHPHSLKDPAPIVDFVLKHVGAAAATGSTAIPPSVVVNGAPQLEGQLLQLAWQQSEVLCIEATSADGSLMEGPSQFPDPKALHDLLPQLEAQKFGIKDDGAILYVRSPGVASLKTNPLDFEFKKVAFDGTGWEFMWFIASAMEGRRVFFGGSSWSKYPTVQFHLKIDSSVSLRDLLSQISRKYRLGWYAMTDSTSGALSFHLD